MRRFGKVFGALTLAVVLAAFFAPQAHATTIKDLQDAISALQATVSNQTAQISALQQTIANQAADLDGIKNSNVMTLDPYLTVDLNDINGMKGPHVIFTGANVHIRSGSGGTGEYPLTGHGNLVIGYNEPRLDNSGYPDTSERGGSHNLVIGQSHKYSSYGGLVAGLANTISGLYASACGGIGNMASGDNSSVSGGVGNIASGIFASISAGGWNTASGSYSNVSAGRYNTASGPWSSVTGGENNTASGDYSSVSGGGSNTASGDSSNLGASVSGGWNNTASGGGSNVSGGYNRNAIGEYDWAAGSLFEDQ